MAERKLDPAVLGGVVGGNVEHVVEVWERNGLECAMVRGPGGVNGYVRLPEPFRSRKILDDDLNDHIEAHGGLTWGMDDGGWVGFDTAHAWDVWLDPDVPESEFARATREMAERDPEYAALKESMSQRAMEDPWTIIWTLEKLRDEVDSVCDQVALFCELYADFESEMSPAERRAVIRAQMDRWRAAREAGASEEEALNEWSINEEDP